MTATLRLPFQPLPTPSVAKMEQVHLTRSLFRARVNAKSIARRQRFWPGEVSDTDILAHRYASFALIQEALWWRLRQLMGDLHTFKLVPVGDTCQVKDMRPSGANHISALDFNDDAMVQVLCGDYAEHMDEGWKGDDHDLTEYGQAFNKLDPLHVTIAAAIEKAVAEASRM